MMRDEARKHIAALEAEVARLRVQMSSDENAAAPR
jgi:hypothetical protein